MENHTKHGAKPGAAAPTESEFNATARAFASRGHSLQRTVRSVDGRVTYVVANWGQSRFFSDWHSVQGFLTQVGGRA